MPLVFPCLFCVFLGIFRLIKHSCGLRPSFVLVHTVTSRPEPSSSRALNFASPFDPPGWRTFLWLKYSCCFSSPNPRLLKECFFQFPEVHIYLTARKVLYSPTGKGSIWSFALWAKNLKGIPNNQLSRCIPLHKRWIHASSLFFQCWEWLWR